MDIRNDITWRFAVVYVGVFLFGATIIGKVIYLQTVEKDKWSTIANTISQKDITIEANRGDICADDGRLLASSLPFYEVRMDVKSPAMSNNIFNDKVDSLALCLARLFADKTMYQYKSELIEARKRGERSFLIHKDVTYLELKELKKFPIFRLGRYKGGLRTFQHNRRKHPYDDLALRTIGRIQNDGETRTVIGIEGAYDHDLRGKKGICLMQKLSENLWVPIGDGNQVEPEDGKDVITTLNIEYQEVAQEALRKQLAKHDAHHGAAILMEVETGEIKAIANLTRDPSGNYIEDYNYALGESTEPGSTFKLASLIAAFEDGYVNLNSTVDTKSGTIKYYQFQVTDTEVGGYGVISVQKAFEASSNVGISKIIFDNYANNPKKFIDRLYSMGLNEKLDLDIKGEGMPYIKYPGDKLWSQISLPQMSIGYEVQLTPLQVLTFYNAIANGGKMVKPKFVKGIRYHGVMVKNNETQIMNPSICSNATLQKVKKLLEGVVEHGTAKNLKNPAYKIAGKTGTAKIYDKIEKSYVGRYKASFVGYFPADHPKYSCMVYIYDPSKEGYYGSSAAAPVFKEIADKVFVNDNTIHDAINSQKTNTIADVPISKSGYRSDLEAALKELGIPFHSEKEPSQWVNTLRTNKGVVTNTKKLQKFVVPVVEGMGAKDAVYLLESAGMKVELKGRGTVIHQSVNAGTPFKKGDKIVLELS